MKSKVSMGMEGLYSIGSGSAVRLSQVAAERSVFFLAGELAADEHGVEALNGGDGDFGDGVDLVGGEELRYVDSANLRPSSGTAKFWHSFSV